MGPHEGSRMNDLTAQNEDAAQAAFRVTGKCLAANSSLEGLTNLDPARHQFEKANYERHLVEAIASALAIRDEFYKGLAIRQIINVCRRGNDLDIANHHSLREQIVKDAPELAGQKKVLADVAPTFVTIHLDGVDHEAIVHMVTKAMREGGASEFEIEGFKEDVNTADLATLLAKAIAWGAPVQFLKDGQPWISGDWRRLSIWQRLKRSFSLLRGSYVHPDRTIELTSEDRS
jgi:hypothetical protein